MKNSSYFQIYIRLIVLLLKNMTKYISRFHCYFLFSKREIFSATFCLIKVNFYMSLRKLNKIAFSITIKTMHKMILPQKGVNKFVEVLVYIASQLLSLAADNFFLSPIGTGFLPEEKFDIQEICILITTKRENYS